MHWTELSTEKREEIVMRLYNEIMTQNTSRYVKNGIDYGLVWKSPETGKFRSPCCHAQNQRSQSHCQDLLGGWFKKNPKWYVENMPDDLCKEIFRSTYADSLEAQQKARETVNDMARDLGTRLQKKEKGFWSIFVEHPDHTFVGKLALWCLLRPFA